MEFIFRRLRITFISLKNYISFVCSFSASHWYYTRLLKQNNAIFFFFNYNLLVQNMVVHVTFDSVFSPLQENART